MTVVAAPAEPTLAYDRRYTGRGPKGSLLAGTMQEYGRDPIGAMRRWRDEYGDLVPIRFGPVRAFMAYGPAEVSELLIDRARDFRKSIGTQMLIPLLSKKLLTAKGDTWLGHRRLEAPAFHRQRVSAYAQAMVDHVGEAVETWRPGDEIDVHDAMTALTLRIVARVLFDADVTPRIRDVAELGTEVQDHFYDRISSLRFLIPTWLPTPGNRRQARTIRHLDEVVHSIIAERDRTEDRGDLLSILLLARDETGRPLTDRQVRDEVMTLMMAGHETTAVALTWAFMLLGRNPAARERLEDELRTVLDGREPTTADVPTLRFTEAVVYETLRLYPPAYATGREAIRDTSIGGVPVHKGNVVFVAMSATHRDPRFYPEPDEFRPERWLDGLEKRLPRGAFFPFGLGPRKCIGASFAMLEATLLLATIAARRRFEVTPDTIPLHPAITLRPAGPVRARVEVAH
jgi:cytochrome P450